MSRWEEVDRLFRRALGRPPRKRAAFLADACGEDGALRAEVEALLAAAAAAAAGGWFADAGDLVGRVWRRMEGEGDAPAAGRLAGDRLGPYRLEARIARGGMGSVYRAHRADGRFEQRVAVKVLRRGLDTEDIVRRFSAERRIMAGFEHPNIARLIDAGETPDGRPYLVMEYVEGEPITDWCDARRRPLDARLELFLAVARAVQHAHRHLVVHRDLKPSNIFVTEEAAPKLLDFGIAKLLDPEADPEASPLTRTGARLLTPRCASPEQLAGDPVTTASDVYQLGLLLYELLSGRAPFAGLEGRELERAIAESDPPPPSRVVTPEAAAARGSRARALARDLAGDLDRIVVRSLRKEPEERYASVEALAADLGRYRAGRPVAAASGDWAYRARKFARRNRPALLAAAGIVVVTAAYVTTLTLQARRLAVERDRAAREAATAQRTTEFLVDLFEVSEPNRAAGDTVSARELLDHGAQRLSVELEGEPVVRATLLTTVAHVYRQLGLYERARPHAQEAVAILRADPKGDLAQRVEALRELAALERRDDPERALELLREALAAAEAAYGPDDPKVAAVLIDFGELSARESSRRALDRALEILRAAPGDVRLPLARALQISGPLVDRETAIERKREALSLARDALGEEHTFVAGVLSDLGLAVEPYDPTEADSLLRRAAEINARIHGPDHAQTLTILNNLAGVRRDRGEFAAAAPLYREILERRRRAYPDDRATHLFPMHGLGAALTETGQAAEGETLLREVVAALDSLHEATGRWDFHRHYARSTLGRALAVQGRFEEAEPLLLAGWRWVERNFGDEGVSARVMLERVARLYEAWGKPGVAAEYRRRLAEATLDADSAQAPEAPSASSAASTVPE